MKANNPFMLEYNNPGDQVAVSTKLCSMGLLHVGPQCGIFSCPFLAPRILTYFPHFWKNFSIIIYCVHMRSQVNSVHKPKRINLRKILLLSYLLPLLYVLILVTYLKIIPLFSLLFLRQTNGHLYTGHYAPKSTHTRS
jgi:hypothetical protein